MQTATAVRTVAPLDVMQLPTLKTGRQQRPVIKSLGKRTDVKIGMRGLRRRRA